MDQLLSLYAKNVLTPKVVIDNKRLDRIIALALNLAAFLALVTYLRAV